MAFADDETGHAVDAEAVGAQVFGVDVVGVAVAFEVGAGGRGVEADGGGDFDQNRGVAGVSAIGEVADEQGVDQGASQTEAGGEADETVGVDRGGGAANEVEAEGDALGAADFGDGGVETAGAILAAELADDVFRARNAGGGHVGVEQEGPPGKVEGEVGAAAQGAHQAADAEEAPGADEIVHNLDGETGAGGADDVHRGRGSACMAREYRGGAWPRASRRVRR